MVAGAHRRGVSGGGQGRWIAHRPRQHTARVASRPTRLAQISPALPAHRMICCQSGYSRRARVASAGHLPMAHRSCRSFTRHRSGQGRLLALAATRRRLPGDYIRASPPRSRHERPRGDRPFGCGAPEPLHTVPGAAGRQAVRGARQWLARGGRGRDRCSHCKGEDAGEWRSRDLRKALVVLLTRTVRPARLRSPPYPPRRAFQESRSPACRSQRLMAGRAPHGGSWSSASTALGARASAAPWWSCCRSQVLRESVFPLWPKHTSGTAAITPPCVLEELLLSLDSISTTLPISHHFPNTLLTPSEHS